MENESVDLIETITFQKIRLAIQSCLTDVIREVIVKEELERLCFLKILN